MSWLSCDLPNKMNSTCSILADCAGQQQRARVTGVEAQMFTFDFLFGVSLGALIL